MIEDSESAAVAHLSTKTLFSILEIVTIKAA